MAQSAIQLPRRTVLTPIAFAVLALVLLIGCTAPATTPNPTNNTVPQSGASSQGLDSNRTQPTFLIVKFSSDYSGDYLGTLSETSGIYTASFNPQAIPSPSDSNSGRFVKLTNGYYAVISVGGTQQITNPQNYTIFTPAILQKVTLPAQNTTPTQMMTRTAEFSSNALSTYVASQSPFTEAYSCKITINTPSGAAEQFDQNRLAQDRNFNTRDRNFNSADRNFNPQNSNFRGGGLGMMRDTNILTPIANDLAKGTIPSNCQKVI